MLALVIAHAVAATAAPALLRALGRRAFLVLALLPAGTAAWALAHTATVVDGERVTETVTWVPALGLDLAVSMGALQWLLVLVVGGVGALVLAYCAWYFTDDQAGLPIFTASLVAFMGAMLGLVVADDLLLLYVFWELTTIFSYLLIGFDPAKRASRLAAMQALLVTTLGGLVMLVGMLLLGQQAGTLRISAILADPPTGPAVTVAVLLILVGAITKSANWPFHFWLPGAMAAPTPVSAYLHAASMVKAGVYLVALLAPAYASVAGWRPALLTLGVVTMLVGGWKALRQNDLKLLLAYGTVSQLGFLVVAAGAGTRYAALSGLALLLGHALFKATLFLVVGIVDHQTGTRDLHRLSGVGRAMPVVAVLAGVAGASMAGLPPTLGFVGKESILAALLDIAHDGDGTGIGPLAGWALVVGVVAGSALTAAYTLRFWWGAFSRKPGVEDTTVRPVPVGAWTAPAVLAALTVALAFAGHPLTEAFAPQFEAFPPGAHTAELALWHGFNAALLLSVVAVLGGVALFAVRGQVCRLAGRLALRYTAEGAYRLTMRGVDRLAVETTGLVQRGSVAAYLVVILLVVLALPGAATVRALVLGTGLDVQVVAWDRFPQVLVAVVVVLAAITAARARRRLRAVALAGVTGYGTAMFFLLQGAPDLALTQVLVETVSLVVFVLVMRRLPDYFSDRPLSPRRYLRAALGVAVGVAVLGFLLVSGAARTAPPVSVGFPEESLSYGGGGNIVNVTLVDIRAWDTMGEIAVLVAAATGVASLIFLDSRLAGIRRVHEIPYPADVQKLPTGPGRRAWLPGPRTLSPERRSIIFEVVTRIVFHTIIVLSIYLLFAGHNTPGGGFAAGIVTGLALVVRYLAGGRYELDEAAPVDAGILMGTGLFIAALAGAAPLAFGGAVLQSAIVDLHLGAFGDLHIVTSLFFDVGVYLVVVGLILDLLRAFGSRIDRHILREEREQRAARAARSDQEVTA